MDRNTIAPYGEVDTIDVPRSTWTRSMTHKTTFNAGKLVPFYVNTDILPATTIKNTTSIVIRMATPIYPVMDNLYLDTYWFKCTKYWYWEHFRAQQGENPDGAWAQEIEYTTPQINVKTPYTVDDVASYMGVPIGISGFTYDRMAIAGYIDIFNQWFRDQNLRAPIQIDRTDSNLDSDGTINTGYGLLPVYRCHDYFSSLLPNPQKSTNPVTIPIATEAPIVTNITDTSMNPGGFFRLVSNDIIPNIGAANLQHVGTGTTTPAPNVGINSSAGAFPSYYDPNGTLIADLSNAVAATINALRLAVATQRILEKDARYGTRYREILKGQWGVTASDEALLTPEYLGGKRIPINIETVLQQSQTSENSPLGETGAFSVTADVNEDFTKSFTKHDMLFGVCCVRVGSHTYQQGLARQFTRMRRFDHYHTSFAHVGNMPVYNYEIFLQSNEVVGDDGQPINNGVMGYKEAWQEYLYTPNRISGMLLSTYAQSLDAWHYGDYYDSLPVLSDEWMQEPINNIDRTLAVQSSEAHQFIADFYVEQVVSAPIPLNRVPGLMDHY